MAFDEKGQADICARKTEICARAYKILTEEVGFPPEDIIFDPNVFAFAIATGIEEHNNYGVNFIEATRWIRQNLPHGTCFGRRVEPVVQLPWQRTGAQGDARGVPVSRHSGGHGYGHRQHPAVGRL